MRLIPLNWSDPAAGPGEQSPVLHLGSECPSLQMIDDLIKETTQTLSSSHLNTGS